jgi:tRNA-Thr(GGU) m(6)t(6)A37 methyltransferase TsaA
MQQFCFEPIGSLESVFPDLRGTPRQGALAPATRARLTLRRDIAHYALDGLEQYSHLWIFFVFHNNTKSNTSLGGQQKGHGKGAKSLKVKIRPPKHDRKVGVFATRSPHRPNPIGQTLAKIDGIDGSTILLSGIDLIDGTPVLDVKPYVPLYDALSDASVAPWVQTAYDAKKIDVTFSEEACAQVATIFKEKVAHSEEEGVQCGIDPQASSNEVARENAKKKKKKKKKKRVRKKKNPGPFRFYEDAETAKRAISQLLAQDVRSGGARSRRQRRGMIVDDVGSIFCISFDGVDVSAKVTRDGAAEAKAGRLHGGAVEVVRVRKSERRVEADALAGVEAAAFAEAFATQNQAVKISCIETTVMSKASEPEKPPKSADDDEVTIQSSVLQSHEVDEAPMPPDPPTLEDAAAAHAELCEAIVDWESSRAAVLSARTTDASTRLHTIRPATPADTEAIIHCLGASYHAGDPVSAAGGCTLVDLVGLCAIIAPRALEDRLSVVAVDRETDEIVGCCLCEDLALPARDSERAEEEARSLRAYATMSDGDLSARLALRAELRSMLFSSEDAAEIAPGMYAGVAMFGVLDIARGLGLGWRLAAAATELVRGAGFVMLSAEVVGAEAARVALTEGTGMEEEFAIQFSEWDGPGAPALKDLPGRASLLIAKL